jgi:hypothetical protein
VCAHAVADADQLAQFERRDECRQVAPEHRPAGDLGALAAAMSTLIDGDDVACRQMRDQLIPDTAVKAGGVHEQQRRLATTQLGVPLGKAQ